MLKKEKLHIGLSILLSLALYACEECADCGLRTRAPKIRVMFSPDMALPNTTNALDSIADILQQNRMLLDTISPILRDSLTAFIERLEADSIAYATQSEYYKAGKLLIKSIGTVGGVMDDVYTDTLIHRFIYLPLDMNTDASLFYFNYLSQEDTLALQYRRELLQDLDGVRLIAEDITMDKGHTSFDSVRLVCSKGKCSHTNATVEVYF